MAWTNIFCSLFWIVVYVTITINNPLIGIVSIVLPHILVIHTGLRCYIEHAGTKIGAFHNSRTRTSAISTVLYFFNNYHLEHYLYPSVPCYKLHAVHDYLKDKGFYKQANYPIETDPFKVFLLTTSLFMYPDAVAGDTSYNPLVTAEIATLSSELK